MFDTREQITERAKRANTPDCAWVYDNRHGCYATGCGEEVELKGTGTILGDVRYEYCPYCGGKIIEEDD